MTARGERSEWAPVAPGPRPCSRAEVLGGLGLSPEQGEGIDEDVDVAAHMRAYLHEGLRFDVALRLTAADRPLSRPDDWRVAGATYASALCWERMGVTPDEAALLDADPVFVRRDLPADHLVTAGRLLVAGARPDDLRDWCTSGLGDLQAWAATGLDPREALTWAAVGFTPRDAAGWASNRWRTAETPWFEHFGDAERARRWWAEDLEAVEAATLDAAGVTPEIAGAYRRADLTVLDTVRWSTHTDDPETARLAMRTGLAPEEAVDWVRRIGDPDLVHRFRARRVSPRHAQQWVRALSADRLHEWLDVHVDLAEMIRWDVEGLGPASREAWQRVGVDEPFQAAVLEVLRRGRWNHKALADFRDTDPVGWVRWFPDPYEARRYRDQGLDVAAARALLTESIAEEDEVIDVTDPPTEAPVPDIEARESVSVSAASAAPDAPDVQAGPETMPPRPSIPDELPERPPVALPPRKPAGGVIDLDSLTRDH